MENISSDYANFNKKVVKIAKTVNFIYFFVNFNILCTINIMLQSLSIKLVYCLFSMTYLHDGNNKSTFIKIYLSTVCIGLITTLLLIHILKGSVFVNYTKLH